MEGNLKFMNENKQDILKLNENKKQDGMIENNRYKSNIKAKHTLKYRETRIAIVKDSLNILTKLVNKNCP